MAKNHSDKVAEACKVIDKMFYGEHNILNIVKYVQETFGFGEVFVKKRINLLENIEKLNLEEK